MSDHEVGTSYDQVPYPSWSFAQSHPNRLASIATLLGLDPPALREARVLELGCAAGGNLIPMALAHPHGYFLGVDLSALEIAEGMQRVAALGLDHIHLRQQDILDFPADAGPFDYIIAHGVYSWIPPHVQQKLLAICRDHLSPNGIAYISYNTLPGWRMRGMIRDMLVYHSTQFRDPTKQVEQARAILQFLAESVSTETPYGAFLKQEVELFQRVSDEYVFHDHLARDNTPVYFHEFMAQALQYGMQYLGEPDLSTMATSTFPTEIEATLQRISKDIVQVEQYMDFLKNRSFRQTLLCRAELTVDRTLDPRHIRRLAFSTPLVRTAEVDLKRNPQHLFEYRGIQMSTDRPILQDAIQHLSDIWPRWLAFDELFASVRDRHLPSGATAQAIEIAANDLAEHLARCYAANVVQIHTGTPSFTADISTYPCACPLARIQAAEGDRVSNRKHEVVKLDEPTRQITQLANGTRDLAAIQADWQTQLAAGGAVLRKGGELVPSDQIDALLESQIQTSLERLRSASLLIS